MVDATKEFFTKYTDFKGRTSRADFWWAVLGLVLLTLVASIICSLFGGGVAPTDASQIGEYFSNPGNIIYIIWCLAIFIPGIAISVRRLHDINYSGWWVLISLVPFVGSIILIVFFCLPAVNEGNNY